jgi:hypothetical protein
MTKCYVGRCKCGGIVAAVVAEADWTEDTKKKAAYEREVAKDVARFIREGLSIEPMEVEEVRAAFGKCTCPKTAKPAPAEPQLALPESPGGAHGV